MDFNNYNSVVKTYINWLLDLRKTKFPNSHSCIRHQDNIKNIAFHSFVYIIGSRMSKLMVKIIIAKICNDTHHTNRPESHSVKKTYTEMKQNLLWHWSFKVMLQLQLQKKKKKHCNNKKYHK